MQIKFIYHHYAKIPVLSTTTQNKWKHELCALKSTFKTIHTFSVLPINHLVRDELMDIERRMIEDAD